MFKVNTETQCKTIPLFLEHCQRPLSPFPFIQLALVFAGLGKTTPDPSASITLDGVEVPLGTGISSGVNDTCLLYNEYPFKHVPWMDTQMHQDALGWPWSHSLPVCLRVTRFLAWSPLPTPEHSNKSD